MDKTVKGATKIKVRASTGSKVYARSHMPLQKSSRPRSRNMSKQSCLRRTAVRLESPRSFAPCSYGCETRRGP